MGKIPFIFSLKAQDPLYICNMKQILLTLMIAFVLTGCVDREQVDRDAIEQYLEDNNLTAEVTDDGIYYIIDQPGFGAKPNLASEVTVHYEGFLLDGSKFDSSYDRGAPATFRLTGVVRGWQLGIPLFREGGKGTLLIPSELGYGSDSPSDDIPRNSVLIFNINLIEVK